MKTWSNVIEDGLLERAEREVAAISLKQCPSWLGDFSFKTYGECYGRTHGPLPDALRRISRVMIATADAESIPWNAAFLQRYNKGEQVKPHRDPENNLDSTLIFTFGSWTGATTAVEDPSDHHGYKHHRMVRNEMMQLPCTLYGRRGPRHYVSPVISGTRYALILNWIN